MIGATLFQRLSVGFSLEWSSINGVKLSMLANNHYYLHLMHKRKKW